MSSKENFNQAMFEMFGIGKDPNEKKAAEAIKKTKTEVKTEMKKEVKPETKKEGVPATKPITTKNYPKTILGEGTVFEGNLTSKGDVEIGGEFKGNISTDGSVTLYSEIQGNIKAENLNVISNTLTGNVTVSGKVTLSAGAHIKGDITANKIICSGRIIGDMIIEEDACFDELSYVEGNITTKYITINHGAYINGKITIKK